ncbi:hypothetical protein FDENT_7203 [Fusarium denticulatum]|uniref:Uncharacterized protein n=1 Tax=Fusarium denticulatum TaxID=48507 RepID=A0A8H5U6I0_9HYPO|nr:hypothetical protein FDENT_7203 [Fusarium denticulatum]
MKRPSCERCNSLEDIKNDSEKRPRMELYRIWRHRPYASGPVILRDPNGMARPRSHTPPLQDYDLPNRTDGTFPGMDAPPLETVDNLRNRRPPSPAAFGTSPSVSGYTSPATQSNPDSPPQSLATSTPRFEEEFQPIRRSRPFAERISNIPLSTSTGSYSESPCRSSSPQKSQVRPFAERISHSPRSTSSESYSESPCRSSSPENSQVHPLFQPNFTSAVTGKSLSPSPMDILLSETSSEMEPEVLDSSEQQSLAIEDTVPLNQAKRTLDWLNSPHIPDVAPYGSLDTSPDHHTEEQYPATEAIWQTSYSSDVDDDSILPEFDVQKPSSIQKMYTAMEIEPSGFGVNSTTIASLPECIRAMIMTFCIEPKDLLALIRSSPVFLQPFCQNRRAIVSRIIKHMRFRFGGDMPRSCLMVARLRNMESKGAAGSPEVRKATAKKAIEGILGLSPKGPLLHPVYSLRHLRFISDTLDTAESVMSSYAYQAWANINGARKLGPSHTAEELVLSKTERKRFMDAIYIYDAYCTAFFSDNAISSGDDATLRQSLLEEDGILDEVIKRFYSITTYLHHKYYYWIDMAIGKGHRDITYMGDKHSLVPHLEKHIDQLINHFGGQTAVGVSRDGGGPYKARGTEGTAFLGPNYCQEYQNGSPNLSHGGPTVARQA